MKQRGSGPETNLRLFRRQSALASFPMQTCFDIDEIFPFGRELLSNQRFVTCSLFVLAAAEGKPSHSKKE